MNEKTNNNPYDTLFRAAFAEPRAAKALTRFLLPKAPRRLNGRGFARAKVTVEPETLVDQNARTHRTDLLLEFTLPRGSPSASGGGARTAYVYVLYEHKAYPHRWVTVQLLRYMATIWDRLAAKKGTRSAQLLPEILPIVIYHGEQEWTEPLQFAQLIEGGPESDHTPHYRPVFVDITEIEDQEITGPLRLMLGLVALKYSRKEMDQPAMDLLTDLLHRGQADSTTRHLVLVVQQILEQVKPEEEMQALVATANRRGYYEVEGGFMTYAEARRKEGLEEGLEQGSLQSRRDTLIRQLDRKFGLTDAERDRITASGDIAALDAALDEILDAESKEQVLAKLS